MKKIFQVSVFAIFILVSCNINSPIAQLDQKPDNIEIKTIPLENTITASPSEDENIESLDFDLEKTQADNFFETSTKLSPTVTRIPTKTPSPLFSINDHQGLFIVAKINKTLNVYTLDGTFIAPLVTNSFDFFNPTYKKQKIIYTTGNEIVIQDLAAMSDKKITIPPNDGINHPVLLSDDKRIMYAARVININGTTGNVEDNISLFIDFLIGDDAPISVFENYQNSISNAEISGDGKWIVFQSDKGRLYGATDLYLLDTACLENRTFCDNYLRRITHGTGESSARSPMWSTDNMNIVYECIIEVPIDSANSELSQKSF